jgi:hypothetical protein
MTGTRKHYLAWAAKPGALQDKAQDTRERYRLLKSMGLCPRCGGADAETGTFCATCRILRNEGRVLARAMKRFWGSRYSPGFEPCLPGRNND